MGEQLSPGRRASVSGMDAPEGVPLVRVYSLRHHSLFFPGVDAKMRRQLITSTYSTSAPKKLGSYADKCTYSSTFVSLKMLIYSEIHIKPLKTFLFTLFKNEKYSFFCHSLWKFFPSHPLPFTQLVIDSNHKTKKQHVNNLLPRKVNT